VPETARLPAAADGGAAITIAFDGMPLTARPGETLATALLAGGVESLRGGPRRLPFCNMGACFECLVLVDGAPARACLTAAAAGMDVRRWEEP
jgi:aerobic-type carbon monoxide dehydrogenase small subunit (CoxS/CutS family)